MGSIVNFFTAAQKHSIEESVKAAELNTSGEIRVHVESACKEDVMDRAAYVFEKLEMHKTELRNGVLFYMAVTDKKFAILGDVGINLKVPANFWDLIKETMVGYFSKAEIAEGLSIGIRMAGEQLQMHFPYQANDTNELSNEISFDA